MATNNNNEMQTRINSVIASTSRRVERSNAEIDEKIAALEAELAKLKALKKQKEENYFLHLKWELEAIQEQFDPDPVTEEEKEIIFHSMEDELRWTPDDDDSTK